MWSHVTTLLRVKTAGVRELKAHLSGYLRDVAAGETVLVTDRGRVVAEVHPPGKPARATAAERYRTLVERGVIRPARKPRDRSWTRFRGLGAAPGTAKALVDW